MSRIFEVLERVQQDRDLFQVPAIAQAPAVEENAHKGLAFGTEGPYCAEDSILKLVQRLFLSDEGVIARPRRVVFCGIDITPGGSQELCARVGRSLAEQIRSRICVVNTDMHNRPPCPVVNSRSTKPPQITNETSSVPMRQVTSNLWYAPQSPEDCNGKPTSFDETRTMIKGLGDDFEYVIISAPPIGVCNDAILLGQICSGVVLVLEANVTRRVTARRAQQALIAGNARLLGTVLNNRTYPIPDQVYRLL